MQGLGAREAGTRILRPIARAADGIAHNRERRRMIHRYRLIDCVMLEPQPEPEHAFRRRRG
jgi:hypothetical protein